MDLEICYTLFFTVIKIYLPTAITVRFNQTAYNVDENVGPVQPLLVFSNPSSTDIIVQVRETEITATGE